jgi:hypothetical protein
MGMPTGEIVARPIVARACGCRCEFQHFARDRYRDQRLAKFRSTRCPPCAARADADRQREVAERPARMEAVRRLPAGALLTAVKRSDGGWEGTLAAGGATVRATAGGLDELTGALARAWQVAGGSASLP